MGLVKWLKNKVGGKSKDKGTTAPPPDNLQDPLQDGLGGGGLMGLVGSAVDLGKNVGSLPPTPQPQTGPQVQPETKAKKQPFWKRNKKEKPLKGKEVLKDRHVKSRNGGAGGGSANEVQRVSYKRGIGSSGQTEGFFKGDWDHAKMNQGLPNGDVVNMPGTGYTVGIQDEDARNSARAVASGRVDSLLGTNVVSQDRFAKHGGEVGVVSPMVKGQALASNVYGDTNLANPERKDKLNVEYKTKDMAKKANQMAGGSYKVDGDQVFKRTGVDNRDVDLTNGRTQQGMANLQLNDYLTGQLDRHQQNIYVDDTGNVTGIDNDLAFGSNYGKDYDTKGAGQHNLGLPTYLDGGTAERIQLMEEEEFLSAIQGKMGDLSYLNEQEIESALGRFRRLKAHVEDLLKDPENPDARLIYNWGGEGIRDMLIEDGKNYLAKHAKTRDVQLREQQAQN
jgi:hypothetical protein